MFGVMEILRTLLYILGVSTVIFCLIALWVEIGGIGL